MESSTGGSPPELGSGVKRSSGRRLVASASHAHAVGAGNDHGAVHGEDDFSNIPWRHRIAYWRSTSTSAYMLDLFQMAISLISCTLYVFFSHRLQNDGHLPSWSPGMEYFLSSTFLAYYLIDMLAAKSIPRYAFSWHSVVDLATMAPVLVAHITGPGTLLVRVARLLRVLRFLQLRKAQRMLDNEIKQQLVVIAFSVLSMTFIASSVIHLVENETSLWPEEALVDVKHDAGLSFFDSFWMCCISFLTVGYGDYVPITTPGRMCILITLICEALLIPQQTNRLVTLLAKQSTFSGSYNGSSSASHVIVTGAVNSGIESLDGPVSTFFQEYFDEDHGNSQNRYAVLLAKGQPSREIQMLLAQPSLSLSLTYIDGSVMAGKDLQRSGALTAKAAFVMCNKFSESIDEEDSQTILRALAIKRHVWEQKAVDIPVFVQLIRPENQQLFVHTMSSHLKYAAAQFNADKGPTSGKAQAFGASGGGQQVLQRQSRSALGGDSRSMSSDGIPQPMPTPSGSLHSMKDLFASALRSLPSGKSGRLRDKPSAASPASASAAGSAFDGRREDSFSRSSRTAPEKADSLTAAGLPSVSSLADTCVCIQELRCNLLAKSCLLPGFSTLVHNLVMSHSGDDDDNGDANEPVDDDYDAGGELRDGSEKHWYSEYSEGRGFEIYRVAISSAFEGLTFTEAADVIYREASMVLFAIELDIPSAHLSTGPRLVLNPGSSFVLPGHPFRLNGCLIATDKKEADVISQVGIRARKRAASSSTAGAATPSSSYSVIAASSSSSESSVGLRGEAQLPSTALGGGEQSTAAAIKLAIDALKARKRHHKTPADDSGGLHAAEHNNRRQSSSSSSRVVEVTADGLGLQPDGVSPEPSTTSPTRRGSRGVKASPAGGFSASRGGGAVAIDMLASVGAPCNSSSRHSHVHVASSESVTTQLIGPATMGLRRPSTSRGLRATAKIVPLLEEVPPSPTQPNNTDSSSYNVSQQAAATAIPSALSSSSAAATADMPAATENSNSFHATPSSQPAAHSGNQSIGVSNTTQRRTRTRSRSPVQPPPTSPVFTPPVSATASAATGVSPPSSASSASTSEFDGGGDRRGLPMLQSPAAATYGQVVDMAAFVEAAIKTKRIRRHIIVCTCDYSSLSSFIAPLRATYLSEHMPVIVMHPEPPSAFEWSKTLLYESVYYMQGSPFEARDLVRAGIKTASSVVLFQLSRSHASQPPAQAAGGSGGSQTAEGQTDAMYICIYRLIKGLAPDIDVVCEIAARSNISYLANYSAAAIEDGGVFSCPPFAAGHVFSPDVLDILLVQAYYNRQIISILTHLVSGGTHATGRNKAWHSRVMAAGYGSDLEGLQESQMYLLPVPQRFVGKPYGELFSSLALQQGIVCLGVRRAGRTQQQLRPKPKLKDTHGAGSGFFSTRKLSIGLNRQSSSGPESSTRDAGDYSLPLSPLASPTAGAGGSSGSGRQPSSGGGGVASAGLQHAGGEGHHGEREDILANNLPYVYTNPKRSTRLRYGDRIFVLSTVDPNAAAAACGPTS